MELWKTYLRNTNRATDSGWSGSDHSRHAFRDVFKSKSSRLFRARFRFPCSLRRSGFYLLTSERSGIMK